MFVTFSSKLRRSMMYEGNTALLLRTQVSREHNSRKNILQTYTKAEKRPRIIAVIRKPNINHDFCSPGPTLIVFIGNLLAEGNHHQFVAVGEHRCAAPFRIHAHERQVVCMLHQAVLKETPWPRSIWHTNAPHLHCCSVCEHQTWNGGEFVGMSNGAPSFSFFRL